MMLNVTYSASCDCVLMRNSACSFINKFAAKACASVSVELSLISSSYIAGRGGCKIISKEEGNNRLEPSSSRAC